MSKLALLGGEKIRTKKFPPYDVIGKEEELAVKRVLDSKVLSGSKRHKSSSDRKKTVTGGLVCRFVYSSSSAPDMFSADAFRQAVMFGLEVVVWLMKSGPFPSESRQCPLTGV